MTQISHTVPYPIKYMVRQTIQYMLVPHIKSLGSADGSNRSVDRK